MIERDLLANAMSFIPSLPVQCRFCCVTVSKLKAETHPVSQQSTARQRVLTFAIARSL